jgi:hypothetical protein
MKPTSKYHLILPLRCLLPLLVVRPLLEVNVIRNMSLLMDNVKVTWFVTFPSRTMREKWRPPKVPRSLGMDISE